MEGKGEYVVLMLGIMHPCTDFAVQAGFYSDVVECWLRMLEVPGSILSRGKRYLAFFHLLQYLRSTSCK